MEGRDSVFGDALASITNSIEEQTAAEMKAKEAKVKKAKKVAVDPLKAGKPKELKGSGGKDMKIVKMEGLVPEEPKDDEATKIKKLTEESDVVEDVKNLIQTAKDALDKGSFAEAMELCNRLADINAAVGEVGSKVVEEPMPEPMPEPEPEMPMGEDEAPLA